MLDGVFFGSRRPVGGRDRHALGRRLYSPKGRLLLGEGLAVAAVGSVAGVLLGVGYAALMLLGLRTWWQAAVAMPELRLS